MNLAEHIVAAVASKDERAMDLAARLMGEIVLSKLTFEDANLIRELCLQNALEKRKMTNPRRNK